MEPTRRARKGKQPRKVSVVPKVIDAQQPSLMVRFKYSNFVTLTEVSGAGAMTSWRVNSLYDPDLTGLGKQPVGYDQYTAIFNRYRVTHCTYKITWINALGNTEVGNRVARVGLYLSPTNSVASDPEAWANQFGAHTKLLGPSTGNQGTVSISGTVDFAKTFGIKPQELTDLDYSATFNASPARVAYMHAFISAIGAAGAVAYVASEFTFVAELSDRISLGMS